MNARLAALGLALVALACLAWSTLGLDSGIGWALLLEGLVLGTAAVLVLRAAPPRLVAGVLGAAALADLLFAALLWPHADGALRGLLVLNLAGLALVAAAAARPPPAPLRAWGLRVGCALCGLVQLAALANDLGGGPAALVAGDALAVPGWFVAAAALP